MSFDCPRCKVPMTPLAQGAPSPVGCFQCGGAWLEPKSAARVCRGAGEEALSATRTLAPKVAADTTIEIACPVCARALTRTFLPSAYVNVDVCEEHGTFFDPNEIAALVASGRRARSDKRKKVGVALGAGAVAVGGVAATALSSQLAGGQRAGAGQGSDLLEAGLDVVEVVAEADGVGEVAGGLFEGLLELIGGLSA